MRNKVSGWKDHINRNRSVLFNTHPYVTYNEDEFTRREKLNSL